MNELWTPERKAIALATCEKWKGTPHKNRIAVHGVGIDCIQFVNEIMIDAGIIERRRFGGYNVEEGCHRISDKIVKALESLMHVERITEPEFGAIAIFKTGVSAGHAGFITDTDLWHCIANHQVMKGQWVLWRHRVEIILRVNACGLKDDPQKYTKI